MFLLFLGMLIYAHNVETKGKQKLPKIKNEFSLVLLNIIINPLSPNGVQHQYSPDTIHTLLRD